VILATIVDSILRENDMKGKKLFQVILLSICVISVLYSEENLSKTSNESVRPTVAVNQDGIVLVVWCENTQKDTEAGNLYYNVYENSQWSGPKNVGITKSEAYTPQLAVDSKGNFHLCYADGSSVMDREIYHAVYTPTTGWSNADMIWVSEDNSEWTRIGIEDDMLHIVWMHQNSPPYSGADIVMQYKKVTDSSWPSLYERISWNANEASKNPAFKVKDNKIYCCYMQGSPFGAPWKLYYKEGDRGINWRPFKETTVSPNAYYPEIEVDKDNNVHLVWSDEDGNFYYREKQGESWKAKKIISDGNAPLQMSELRYRSPALTAVFTQIENNKETLYYAVKKDDENWELPVQISPAKQGAGHPRVWIDENYVMHVVWEDKGGIGSNREIWYERLQALQPVKAPQNFTGQVLENKALFYRECIHHLTWQANPENENIVKYKLYEIDGINRLLVDEINAGTLEYYRRFAIPNKSYTYELVAVDDKDIVGEAASLTIQ
jgi:hypothetical protein